MKPCTPRAWSSRRLAFGAAGLLAAGGLVSGMTASLAAGLLTVVALAAADWLALRLDRGWSPGRFTVTCHLETPGTDDALLPGGTVVLRVCVGADEHRRALVLPVVPPHVLAAPPGAVKGMLGPQAPARLRFEFRVDRVGRVVFPGVLVRGCSPLRLFVRSVLLVDRSDVAVLPDYRISAHPLVARFLRTRTSGERSRRNVLRGLGSDFHELRAYQPGDVQRRVDWKATARRGRLLVREFEEPREFTVRVVLDGSIDMLRGGDGAEFAAAADVIAKLAIIAQTQSMGMTLTVYDRTLVQEVALARGRIGLVRLMTALLELPAQPWRRVAAGATTVREIAPAALRLHRRLRRRWVIGDSGEGLEAFLARYRPDVAPPRRALAFLCDLDPSGAAGVPTRCDGCGTPVAPDAATCPGCRRPLDETGLPPRAACAAALIAHGMRRARGREMLLFISSLRGGEVGEAVGAALRIAAAGHRTVHVLLPRGKSLEDTRPVHPGSLGHEPAHDRALDNLDRLHTAARFLAFRRDLEDAGVHVHWIDDRDALDEVINDLLQAEVVGASVALRGPPR